MKKVLTFGVYDLTHIGHIKLFERAKALGDYLIVAIQETEYIKKTKPNAYNVYNTEERLYFIDSIKFVDKVITYKNVNEDIKNIDFDIFVKGPDQCHTGFQEAINWCKEQNKEIITLPRTEDISTSELVLRINDIFNK